MLGELMWPGIEDGYRRLTADQAGPAAYHAAYRAETVQWTCADAGLLAATAAEEQPRHNA